MPGKPLSLPLPKIPDLKFRITSVTTKLLFLFLLVGVVSLAAVGTYAFYAARRAIIHRTMDHLISVRAVKKQQMEYFFTEKLRNLEYLANISDIAALASGTGSQPRMNEARRKILSYDSSYRFSNIYLAAVKDSVLKTQSPVGKAVDFAVEEKLKTLLRQDIETEDPVIIDLFFRSADDSVPVCLLCRKMRMAQGIEAVVAIEVSSSEINAIMLQNNSKIGLGNSGESYLVGSDLMMRSESRFIMGSVLRTKVGSVSARRSVQGETGVMETSDYRNIRVFSAYEPLQIPGLQWAILAEMDYAESVIPVERIRNDILIVSVVISVFILGIARLISIMVTQPIIRLRNTAKLAGYGNLSVKAEISSADEIGDLALTFNHMIDSIREEREQRFSAMYDGQELERSRVSRELHDSLGQRLVGAKLMLENCDSGDLSCMQSTVSELKTTIASLIEETREISSGLMPPALSELGLSNALMNLCTLVERQSGIKTDFFSDGEIQDPGIKISAYLYRMAQETLNNTLKHASSSEISMQLIGRKEILILITEDNGRGFDVTVPSNGNGLKNMKERASILGGTVSIESGPGKGTTVRIKIPLE